MCGRVKDYTSSGSNALITCQPTGSSDATFLIFPLKTAASMSLKLQTTIIYRHISSMWSITIQGQLAACGQGSCFPTTQMAAIAHTRTHDPCDE
jgi:hypothetical protein